MKRNCLLILALALSTSLFAQEATNAPAAPPPAKPAPPPMPIPTEPLSKAALDKIAAMTPIFDGKTLDGWIDQENKGSATGWIATNGAIASTGAERGTLYTKNAYGNYRITFLMRHVSGNKDHQACVLVYCYEPTDEQKALDALGGVQFQVPNGGSWDYRPGKNNGGKGVFTKPPHPKFDVHEWSQVEILVNTNGTARMAVAQPPGNKAVETLDFNDPTAGRVGPFALQMHNKGLFDEYKDIRVEENPTEDKLITTE